MKIIRARDVLGNSVARGSAVRLRGVDAFPEHRHDFPEVFWVTEGRGMHRVNGAEQVLDPGVLVWVRAADVHAFSSDEAGMFLHNVAFSPAWFSSFRRRHFADETGFWSGEAQLPELRRLGGAQLERLAMEFAELGRGVGAPRDVERFLLNVLHLARTAAAEELATDRNREAPDWLEPALRAWAEPEAWVGGTRALARLAGRGEDHVARVVKATTGRSPTDLLNAHRMRHAAHLLAATDRKIIDVALECGFASLGHFYAMFRRHHGCAPADYRARQPPRPV